MEKTDLMLRILLEAGILDIREVPKSVITNDGVKELPLKKQPFLYASGFWGPGYISAKNLVGRKGVIKILASELAEVIAGKTDQIDFVVGNVTGGVVPGWLISEELGKTWGRCVPFIYVRESRKIGGQKELLTGNACNPEIHKGNNALIVEELVNFAQTTCNSALIVRQHGFIVTHGATFLFYLNPVGIESLKNHEMELVYLFTLPQLLDVAEKCNTHPSRLIDDYRSFLEDPTKWQETRSLTHIERGGTLQ